MDCCNRYLTEVSGQRNVLENVLETSPALATYFHVDVRTIRRDMSTLQAKGIIRCDGPDKGGRWIVLQYTEQTIKK